MDSTGGRGCTQALGEPPAPRQRSRLGGDAQVPGRDSHRHARTLTGPGLPCPGEAISMAQLVTGGCCRDPHGSARNRSVPSGSFQYGQFLPHRGRPSPRSKAPHGTLIGRRHSVAHLCGVGLNDTGATLPIPCVLPASRIGRPAAHRGRLRPPARLRDTPSMQVRSSSNYRWQQRC